ncbi:MAG: adenylyl-sulfate kinase [Terracidiphilus sp.]
MAEELYKGFTLWLTGMSGAGKTTISSLVGTWLREQGARVELLDGDEVRKQLSKGLGFNREDRDENIRRIGFVAELLCRNGVIAIVAAISPYRAVRQELRLRIGSFVEIHVDCPMDVLIARDEKGLYKKAMSGEIVNFTGISDPYEPPLAPELVIDSSTEPPEQSAMRVWNKLKSLGMIHFDR